jgi:hypothetical protein
VVCAIQASVAADRPKRSREALEGGDYGEDFKRYGHGPSTTIFMLRIRNVFSLEVILDLLD